MDKLSGPSGRVGGDFDFEVMEAFRNAYAQQLASPDQDEIANNSGLPTNTVSNTSPWLETTGLWKYPSGKGPEEDLKAPFNPSNYYSNEVVDGDEEIDQFDDEEVDTIVNELSEGEYEGEYEEE